MAEKMPKITGDTLVTTTELAAVLGVTARRVQQLAQDSVFVAASNIRGKYPLADSVQKYIAFLVKEKNKDTADVEREKIKNEALIKKAKATVVSLEAQELVGKMHRSEDVQAMTEELLFAVRGGLLALPGRLAVDTASATNASETSEIIRREVHKVMSEIASFRYDPEKYAERVRERKNWETGTDDE